jgi:S-adenosylmethionine synthetase
LLFTSESVTEGHPDKIADQISDAVLDAILTQDPLARVACECLVTTGMAFVAGEIKTTAQILIPDIVREKIHQIGYTSSDMGFDYKSCAVINALNKQSSDIDQGVSIGKGLYNQTEQGAGDQGLMFGYATDETPEFMPASIHFAHKLAYELAQARKQNRISWLKPDGKTQVTIEYDENKRIKRIDTIVISAQHEDQITHHQIQEALKQEIIKNVIPQELMDNKTKIFINPTGRFVLGGPHADCGLTGRKIIVDTYGGHGAHGGGAFSGKDPSKVDRTASYMARYAAKNVVAAGLAKKCLIQVAYAIGIAEPVSIMVQTDNTHTIALSEITARVKKLFPFKPTQIIQELDLLRPIFAQTAAYGHFGRNQFPWEKTDKIEQLKNSSE